MSVAKKIYDKRSFLFKSLLGKRVAFHHVPKCAGTSVSRALRKKYALSQQSIGAPLTVETVQKIITGKKNYYNISQEIRTFRMALFDYFIEKDYFLVGGHVPFSSATYEKFKNNRYFITVLRDPVDRFLSEFSNNQHKSTYSGINMSLKEFIDSEEAVNYGARYCEYFCGKTEYNGPTGDMISYAIKNLSCFSVVGLMDNMHQFSFDLKAKIGVQAKFAKENVSKKSIKDKMSAVDSLTLKKIQVLCAPDMEIYTAIRDN